MKGLQAAPGIAVGRAYIDWREQIELEKDYVEDGPLEADRLDLALETVQADFQAERGEAAWAEFFDARWFDRARQLVLTKKYSASWALHVATQEHFQALSGLDTTGRADKINDLSNRLNRLLLHMETVLTPEGIPGARILVCKTITRDDMALIQQGKVQGVVCEADTLWSHGIIAARDASIPAVTGMTAITEAVDQGDMMILDGSSGEVFIAPDEETVALYQQKCAQRAQFRAELQALIGRAVTDADGMPCVLQGNASTPSDVGRLVELGAGGIGLYRTEYLYLTRDQLPGSGEQYYDYKRAVTAMHGSPVVFRTLDLGADKMPRYLAFPDEVNPAFGHRGIRYSLNRVDLFRDQLKALLQASALGDVGIMLPMVSAVGELRAARAVLDDLKEEFSRSDVPFNPRVQLGVMVETPAAAMEADILAAEADFLSIGSNDLVQYALAVDRNNNLLSARYTPFAPGCLRLIQWVIRACNRAGKAVSLCGEMAGDPLALPLLFGMGLRRFSVNPSSLLHTQWILSQLHADKCEALAEEALSLSSAGEVQRFCRKHFGLFERKD